MRKKLLVLLAVLVLVLVGIVLTRPDTYHVERSAVMSAPPGVVFTAVNDFHSWDSWSPWAKLDPGMEATIDGPPAGVGQKYHWTGNHKVGEGEMRLAESTPASRIHIELDFLKPFKSSSTITFTFAPEGGGTKVTWAMDGRADFLTKAMCMITPMDKVIGPDFEKGLASLTSVSETAAAAAAADTTSTPPAEAGGAGR